MEQKNLGQNWGSDKFDVAYMDKCHQDIRCLDNYHHQSLHLLKLVPRTLPLMFCQNWVSNSLNNPDMDKFHQDLCYLLSVKDCSRNFPSGEYWCVNLFQFLSLSLSISEQQNYISFYCSGYDQTFCD